MDIPLNRPTPSYPADYGHSKNTPDAPRESPNHVTLRETNSALDLSGLGGKRDQSFLSLASLSLAHSSSSLLAIFSSAPDSLPDTPVSKPRIEMRRERAVIEELDRWTFICEIIQSMSVLFALGYAFAMCYFILPRLLMVVYYYHWRITMNCRFRTSRL